MLRRLNVGVSKKVIKKKFEVGPGSCDYSGDPRGSHVTGCVTMLGDHVTVM